MSKYQTIAKELRDQILLAKSVIPHKLPTEAALCEKYRVSRQTIRQALLALEKENLITRRQGSGAYTVPQSEHLREKKIVLLISNREEYIYPKFIGSFESELRKQHLSLSVFITGNDVNTERSILSALLEDSVFLLISELPMSLFPNPNMDLYEKLLIGGSKIIFLNPCLSSIPGAHFVYSDDITGGRLAGEHLISMQRFTPFTLLPDYDYNANLRYAGLQSAYKDALLKIPTDNIFRYSKKDLSTLRSRQDTGFLTDFIRRYAQHCDSVLCYNDEIAYWLMKELSYAGISVPGQIAVISFDNSYLCTLSSPSITSLRLPLNEPTATLCSMVQNLLVEKEINNKILPWEIVSRGSAK